MEGGGVESAVMQAVQLSIANGVYAATVREALSRSCAWHVETVDHPDPSQKCVLVLDELAFARLPLPLSNPERVVLITRKEPQLLAQAWEAGIVSVVSEEDPISTVLLAFSRLVLNPGLKPWSQLPPARIAQAIRHRPPSQAAGEHGVTCCRRMTWASRAQSFRQATSAPLADHRQVVSRCVHRQMSARTSRRFARITGRGW